MIPIFPGAYNVTLDNLRGEELKKTAERVFADLPVEEPPKMEPINWPFPRFMPTLLPAQCYICTTPCKTVLEKCEYEGQLIDRLPVCYRCVVTYLEFEVDAEAFAKGMASQSK